MKKYTYHLFVIAFALSMLSFFTIKAGYGEIYPFFTWRLFTKPSGTSTEDFQYKLYGLVNRDTIRLKNTDSKLYDGNEKASLINNLGCEVDQNKNSVAKQKLYRFARVIAPSFQEFLLVKETFNVQTVDEQNFKIHKKIITKLK